MNGLPPGETEISETDILFECGACGKSLVIEERGAGMLVQCTDCGETMRVPEREVQEGTVSQSGTEPSGAAIEAALINARRRIASLEEELESLHSRRKELEDMRTGNLRLHTKIWEEVVQIGDAAARIEDLLGMSSDEQPPTTDE